MPAKRGWAKSTNGPDWVDLRAMMIAMGVLHSAHVEVTVSPLGIGSTGCVQVTAAAIFDLLPGSSLPPEVEVRAEWPNARNAQLTDIAYNLLWQLDHEIGKVYEQGTLFEA